VRKISLLGLVVVTALAALVLPTAALANHTPQVGEMRAWLGLDDEEGVYYRKNFQLRGIGKNIEVWVATGYNPGARGRPGTFGTEFTENKRLRGRGYDCRNDDARRVVVTDEQVQYFINEFDNNIYPKESASFSVPPPRNGSRANVALRAAPYHPTGKGDNIVVLVDNFRDENFYDYNNVSGHTYIAGFFSSQLQDFFDRNMMHVDAFDWFHRTGANPPDDSRPGDNCNSAAARPFLYESVFAHEYQHLLMGYEDPDEVNWVNEGLADWAQTLTGYVTPNKTINELGSDSHVQNFLGWLAVQTPFNPNPRLRGGAENSLTLWEDQGGGEVLADYGAAYTLMELLAGRYGTAFMSAFHREDANGIPGLQKILNSLAGGKKAADVIHEWAAMVALDRYLDEGRTLIGGDAALYRVPTLNAAINWDNPESYSTAGAPPNGSDYVRLRDGSGKYLSAGELNSLTFDGASTLASRPVEWSVINTPPADAGDTVLYSGTGNNLDRAIVREVAVPATGTTLSIRHQYNLEIHWDFGFVQVSTNAGETYTSLACTGTTTETDDGAIPAVKANVPGYSGDSGGWRTDTCDLAPYAGRTVLLSFRFITDPAVEGETTRIRPGWYIDTVTLGGTLITDGSTLTGFRSLTQVRPVRVSGFTVQLIGYHSSNRSIPARIGTLRLDANMDATLDRAAIQAILGGDVDVVAAIVMYDEPTETISQYAPYKLTVNGALQPGGDALPGTGGASGTTPSGEAEAGAAELRSAPEVDVFRGWWQRRGWWPRR